MFAFALLVSSAFAFSVEIGATNASLPLQDEDFAFVSPTAMPILVGVRGGFGFDDHVAIVADARWGAMGSTVSSDRYDSFQSAMYAGQYALGARAGVPLANEVLRPYATAQVTLLHAQVKFDDDPNDDRSLGQSATGAWAPGVVAAAGFEVSPKRAFLGLIDPAVWVEVGYGYTAPLSLGDLGALRPGGGLAARGGLMLRFE
jgi:hypothetical protein